MFFSLSDKDTQQTQRKPEKARKKTNYLKNFQKMTTIAQNYQQGTSNCLTDVVQALATKFNFDTVEALRFINGGNTVNFTQKKAASLSGAARKRNFTMPGPGSGNSMSSSFKSARLLESSRQTRAFISGGS